MGNVFASFSALALLVGRKQWRQRECNFRGDAESTRKQLQGTRVSYSLDDNAGRIASPREVCAKPAELRLNENSCEQNDNFR